MSLASQTTALATRVGQEIKAVRTEMAALGGGGGALTHPLTWPEGAEPPTPAAGKVALYSVDGTALLMKNDAGAIVPVGGGTKMSALAAATTLTDADVMAIVNGAATKKVTLNTLTAYFESRARVHNASTANQTGFAAATYLAGSDVAIPTGRLQAKSKYHCVFNVTKTAAGTVAPTIDIRVGTAGTTADASRCLMTLAAQTAAIDEGRIEVMAHFRTVGSGTTAVIVGMTDLTHRLAATGLSTSNSSVITTVGGGFDSTVANLKIGLVVNGGTSAAWTVNLVEAELMNLA